jgi:ABC-type molybdate transport system substrate-binding protein
MMPIVARILAAGLVVLTVTVPAAPAQGGRPAATVSVLATNAIIGPLTALAEDYKRQTGTEITLAFETSPNIARRLAAGELAGMDVIILAAAAAEQAVKEGKALADGRVHVGRSGVGVAIRRGARRPDISSVDALKAALLHADRVLYTQGASGVYVEKLLQTFGIADALKGRSQQLTTGDAMLERLATGTGNEIGFTQVSEIKRGEGLWTVSLVAPLPAAVQNYTSFDAIVMSGSRAPDAARAFVRTLTTPAARKRLTDSGWVVEETR